MAEENLFKNEDKALYLFVDAETNGLYGTFLSVAMILTDSEGNKLESCYVGRKEPEKLVTNSWVRENVLPYMGTYEEYDNEESLLERAWSFWKKHAENTYVITDIMHPIESRLFSLCVISDKASREFQGPFPMLDLSSMLYAIGIDPLKAREELAEPEEKGRIHNALYDAAMTLAVWKKYILHGQRER